VHDQFFVDAGMLPLLKMRQDLRTDREGRFVFEYVPPFPLVLKRIDDQTPFGIHVSAVSVKPGDTNHLEFNWHRRTIIGQVMLQPGLGPNTIQGSWTAALAPVICEPNIPDQTVYFLISPKDGAFHTDLLEPGDYRIFGGELSDHDAKVAFLEPKGETAAAVLVVGVGNHRVQPVIAATQLHHHQHFLRLGRECLRRRRLQYGVLHL